MDYYTTELYKKVRELEDKVARLEGKLLDITLNQNERRYMTDDEEIAKLIEDVA